MTKKYWKFQKGIIYPMVENDSQITDSYERVWVLHGKSRGTERVSLAIAEAMTTLKDGEDNRLYAAHRVLINVVYPSSVPLLLGECEALVIFSQRFAPETSCIWEISDVEEEHDLCIDILAYECESV